MTDGLRRCGTGLPEGLTRYRLPAPVPGLDRHCPPSVSTKRRTEFTQWHRLFPLTRTRSRPHDARFACINWKGWTPFHLYTISFIPSSTHGAKRLSMADIRRVSLGVCYFHIAPISSLSGFPFTDRWSAFFTAMLYGSLSQLRMKSDV